MAALLVGMSVMAVLMSALLPVWSHMATREKEEELIFRGKQYARAIGLFQRKYANTPPPSIDVLVEQRFLRKKYKDPITKDEFQPIYANQAVQAPGAPAGAQRPGQQPQRPLPRTPATTLQSGFGSTGAGPQGGIIGVTSKSKDARSRSTTAAPDTTSGRSSTFRRRRRPGQPGRCRASRAAAGQPGSSRSACSRGSTGRAGSGQRPNGQQPRRDLVSRTSADRRPEQSVPEQPGTITAPGSVRPGGSNDRVV